MKSKSVTRPQAARVPLFALAALLPALAVARPPAPSPGEVPRLPLESAPQLLGSIAWDPSGDRLVLAEGGSGGAFFLYDSRGKLLERKSAADLGITRPHYLTATPRGFFLNDFPRRLVWTDDRLVPLRALDLKAHGQPGKGTLDTFWSWAATPAATVYGFSDVQLGPQLWKSGYVRLRTAPDVDFDFLHEVDRGTDRLGFDLCRAGYPCAATLGERGFFLVQSDPPALYEASPAWRALPVFPAPYAKRPKLPLLEGAKGYPFFMRALEKSTTAVALYGRGSTLYLLARSPLPGGRTRWEVLAIDPQRNKILPAKTLPTDASHVALAPGPKFWAVVEQGPVEADGEQATLGLRLVPTREIEAGANPTERAVQ